MSKFLLMTAILGASAFPSLGAATTVEERIVEVAGIKVAEAQEVFSQIKRTTLADDRAGFAALVHYPFTVGKPGQEIVLHNSEELATAYPSLVTKAVRKAVAAQKFENLFVNGQGIMIGNGQIWFGGVCPDKSCETYRVYVIAINPNAPEVAEAQSK